MQATVKKYSCLWTADVNKKNKVWQDGYVQLHHYNAKLILLDESFKKVEECFFKYPSLANPRRYGVESFARCNNNSHNNDADGSGNNNESLVLCPTQELAHEMLLPQDEQINLERHVATIESIECVEYSDLSSLLEHARGTKRKLHDQQQEIGHWQVDNKNRNKSKNQTQNQTQSQRLGQNHTHPRNDPTTFKQPQRTSSTTYSNASLSTRTTTGPSGSSRRRLGTTAPTVAAHKTLQKEWEKSFENAALFLNSIDKQKQSSTREAIPKSTSCTACPNANRPLGLQRQLNQEKKKEKEKSVQEGQEGQELSQVPPSSYVPLLSASKNNPDSWDDGHLKHTSSSSYSYPSSFL